MRSVFAPLARCASRALLMSVAACAGAPSAAPPRAQDGATELIVVRVDDDAPPGSDAAPRTTLAFRDREGRERAIPDLALSFAPFRDGVAIVDLARRVVLIRPDGSRSVLAQRSGASPQLGPRGELYYVARYGTAVEAHRLEPDGRDRVIADGVSNAGVLTPLPNGALLFVGARSGGVAGMWISEPPAFTARCLTHCDLRTGKDWPEGARYAPPPGSQDALRDAYRELVRIEADGKTSATTAEAEP